MSINMVIFLIFVIFIFYRHKRWAMQSVKNILECNDNIPYTYVTSNDILQCFDDETVIVLRGDDDANVNVYSSIYVSN